MRDELRLARADDRRRAALGPRILGKALRHFVGEPDLVGVRVGHRQPEQLAVLVDEVDRTPVREPRHRQRGNASERGLVVQRRGEQLARFDDEPAFLRGAGLALDELRRRDRRGGDAAERGGDPALGVLEAMRLTVVEGKRACELAANPERQREQGADPLGGVRLAVGSGHPLGVLHVLDRERTGHLDRPRRAGDGRGRGGAVLLRQPRGELERPGVRRKVVQPERVRAGREDPLCDLEHCRQHRLDPG